ncbi:MAG: hypothetical protein ABI119_06015 [Gemmatimonadaceae bacterium]
MGSGTVFTQQRLDDMAHGRRTPARPVGMTEDRDAIPFRGTVVTGLQLMTNTFAQARAEFLMAAAREQGLDPSEWIPDFTQNAFVRPATPKPSVKREKVTMPNAAIGESNVGDNGSKPEPPAILHSSVSA